MPLLVGKISLIRTLCFKGVRDSEHAMAVVDYWFDELNNPKSIRAISAISREEAAEVANEWVERCNEFSKTRV